MPQDDWSFIRSETLRDYRVLSLREDRYRFNPTGSETGFAICESLDWVLVIPVTADHQVVFVRQFRPGLGQAVLEIPGGTDQEIEDFVYDELLGPAQQIAGMRNGFLIDDTSVRALDGSERHWG